MKNKILTYIFPIFFFSQILFAENLNIQSKNISIDKKTRITIFKDSVVATDGKNNKLNTEFAEYKKEYKYLESKGKTTIKTSEGFLLEGENIVFDNKNNLIESNYPAELTDLENNKIFLDKFKYSTDEKFFTSTGNIKVIDSRDNSYNFSQIYIDEKTREIIGTDIKAFLNHQSFKIDKKNKPRVFANTAKIDDKGSEFTKSVFTLCNYREKDKCPPWEVQASKMRHDKEEKTIYYDNALIKFYNIPIFYTPKLSHPDPSVDRRSGFLPPVFSDSKNLGPGLKVPYYWTLNDDKDFTLTNQLFSSEHPLFLGEYRQAFKKSNLIFDFGYTEGYKKNSTKKTKGDKSHFFSKFVKNFKGVNDSDNNLEITFQELSNDKYLKLYKIKSNLVDYEKNTLENTLSFTHENEDLFLGFKASAFESLKEDYNDKYEYILPDVILDKNLFSSIKYGNADLTSNLKIHNYDTNRFTKFLVNDVEWKSKKLNLSSGFNGTLLGKFKNVNYESKNVSEYKDDPTNEMFGALGYLGELDLFKKTKNNSNHFLTPKILLRYAPGHMRKQKNGPKLNHLNVFSLDMLNTYNNFENGLSTAIGFDYKLRNSNRELELTVGQIVNAEENKDMPSSSSLDEKLSDLVGSSNLKINNKINFNYNFSLDQNYKDLNYNEIGSSIDLNPIKFDFSYLQEKKHIGQQEYFKTKIGIEKNQNGLFSAEVKRNLITNSAEYYNLSYEYINDCLRAGLVYRREFYNDSELEPENSLMFKITLTPFGNINSPSFN